MNSCVVSGLTGEAEDPQTRSGSCQRTVYGRVTELTESTTRGLHQTVIVVGVRNCISLYVVRTTVIKTKQNKRERQMYG
jgi:hypothetical protein